MNSCGYNVIVRQHTGLSTSGFQGNKIMMREKKPTVRVNDARFKNSNYLFFSLDPIRTLVSHHLADHLDLWELLHTLTHTIILLVFPLQQVLAKYDGESPYSVLFCGVCAIKIMCG